MKTRLRAALVCVLFVLTAVSVTFVIADFVNAEDGAAARVPEETEYVCYVLRDYEGYVAIFMENNSKLPMTVTDIQTSTLRALDRKLLETGMKLYSRERLMMILEDLGS